MGMSLAQFRDQVELGANIKGDPDFGVTRVNRKINLACRYVQIQLNGLGFKKWETAMPITPLAGTFSGAAIKKIGVNNLTNMLESPRSIPFKRHPILPIACPRAIKGASKSRHLSNPILFFLINNAAATDPKINPPNQARPPCCSIIISSGLRR